ncbi:caspase family protein [Pedobacter aquatilis]|uniref:caspase family protein n=1 Tax=Pedobacter aquatilis TaxID=351343 RepID=UPI002930CF8A|nr:caspase family protein [Pedobacter aquatilis]
MIIPTGHSGAIEAMAFDGTESRLFTIGRDGQLKCWDVSSHKELRSLQVFNGENKSIEHYSIAISPDNAFALVSKSILGGVWLVDLRTFKTVRKLEGSYIGISGLCFSKDGKSAFIGCDNGVFQLNLEGKELKSYFKFSTDQILQGKNYVQLVKFSSDRSLIAIGLGNTLKRTSPPEVVILDAVTGGVRKKFETEDHLISDIDFSADKSQLLLLDDGAISLLDMRSGERKKLFDPYSRGNVLFGPDGRTIIHISPKGDLNVVDIKTLKSSIRKGSSFVSNEESECVLLHRRSATIFQGMGKHSSEQTESGFARILDPQTLEILGEFRSESSAVYDAAFHPDKQLLITTSGDGLARIWNLAIGGITKVFGKGTGTLGFEGIDYYRNAAFSPDGHSLMLNSARGVLIYDRNFADSLKIQYYMANAVAFANNGDLISSGSYEKVSRMAISNDPVLKATELNSATSEEKSFAVLGLDEGKILMAQEHQISISGAGKLENVFKLPTQDFLKSAALLPQQDLMVYCGGFTTGVVSILNYKTGENLFSSSLHKLKILDIAVSSSSGKMATASADKTLRIWDIRNPNNPAVDFVLRGHKDAVLSCNFTADGKMLVSTSADKTTKIWDVHTGMEIATLVSIGDEWIIVTPEGYYFASAKGARLLHFLKDGKLRYFDQYDLIYNRPDLVLEKIGQATKETIETYFKAYQTRISKTKLSPNQLGNDFGDVPTLSVENAAQIPPSTKSSQIILSLHASEPTSKLERLHVKINGVPIYGKAGRKLSSSSSVLDEKLQLELTQGNNQIDISVLSSKGILSQDASVNIYLTNQNFKPDLYVMSVGLSDYKNKDFNLNYAAKDARDVAKYFGSNKDNFGKVIIDTILNSSASKSAILALKKRLQQTRPGDQVILFFAGHGQIFNSDYYLSAFDQDFSDPKREGLLYDDFENLLDGIPARQKILFIDACHSGEFDKTTSIQTSANAPRKGNVKKRGSTSGGTTAATNSSFELMKVLFSDLRESNGASIISSASSTEFAWEDDRWSNGVFTYSMLAGLKDKSADLNRDGKIMLSELLRFVQHKVSILTDEIQMPTSRRENIISDFRLY